jgi:hypothetical protein
MNQASRPFFGFTFAARAMGGIKIEQIKKRKPTDYFFMTQHPLVGQRLFIEV